MSKRKAPQESNPNADICDILIGELIRSRSTTVLGHLVVVPVPMCVDRASKLRAKCGAQHPQVQCVQVGVVILYLGI